MKSLEPHAPSESAAKVASAAKVVCRGSERTWLYWMALNLLRDHARRAGPGGGAAERLSSSVGQTSQ